MCIEKRKALFQSKIAIFWYFLPTNSSRKNPNSFKLSATKYLDILHCMSTNKVKWVIARCMALLQVVNLNFCTQFSTSFFLSFENDLRAAGFPFSPKPPKLYFNVVVKYLFGFDKACFFLFYLKKSNYILRKCQFLRNFVKFPKLLSIPGSPRLVRWHCPRPYPMLTLNSQVPHH